jgi:UDP-sulfoquinovose synthase
MRVFIAGIDGYLGWPLAQHLARRGHEIAGCDTFFRRQWVAEMGSHSATPIGSMQERLAVFRERYAREMRFFEGDLRNFKFVDECCREFQPESIVHLGEVPSAPFSMIDVDHAVFTQVNNIVGTLNIIHAMRHVAPEAQLVKLGTMGEYGTPNVEIPEGFFEIEYRGRTDRLPFPRQAGSWYHWSKVHDSNNVMFACRVWGLRATDVMQGVVFGTRTDEMGEDDRLLSRLDFDQAFGTVVNRFCCQAVIGHPLTPFGKGHQRRGFLPLRDSMQCLTLAIEHPAGPSEYRVLNQFEEVYDVTELALKVAKVGAEIGVSVDVRNIENPRKEAEEHFYKPEHGHLFELGYRPTRDVEGEIRGMLFDLLRFRERIEAKREVLLPDIWWNGTRKKAGFVRPGT